MDMQGDDKVILREGTSAYPMAFIFAPSSAGDQNDGSIPFGTTISSAAITVLSSTGADITSEVAGTVSVVGGLQVKTTFSYPTSAVQDGDCSVTIELTLSSAAVLPKVWDGLRIET